MSDGEAILTCASCGKSFKGSPGSKKFHCATCHEVTTVGTQPGGGSSGKILCGNCWSGMELREELYKTSQNLMGGAGNGTADQALVESNRALEERLTEMQTRLTLAEEGRGAALRERDISAEARAKLEKTLAEFLGKFASVREAEVVAIRERDAAREECRNLERKMKELSTQVQLATETQADTAKTAELEAKLGELHGELVAAQVDNMSICAERDMAVTARQEMEAKIADLNDRLAKAHEAQVQAAKERDEALASAKAAAVSGGGSEDAAQLRMELNRLREAAVTALEPLGLECNTKMKDLMGETENVLSEARLARDKALEHYESLDKMLSSLRTNINLARRHVTGRVAMVLGSPAGESGFNPAMPSASGSGTNKAATSSQNKAVGNKSGIQPSASVAAAGE